MFIRKPGILRGRETMLIVFSTKMQKAEIEDCMSEYYVFDGWDCYVDKTEDGYYTIYINTSAPFAHNIEGH